jgi:hypothetical protein
LQTDSGFTNTAMAKTLKRADITHCDNIIIGNPVRVLSVLLAVIVPLHDHPVNNETTWLRIPYYRQVPVGLPLNRYRALMIVRTNRKIPC